MPGNAGTKRVTIDSFDSSSIGNEQEYLNALINNYDFLLFLKTDCPLSMKLKTLLDTLEIKHTEMFLDNHVNGPRLQHKLAEMTSGRLIPYLYVNHKYVGGYTETAELISTGCLYDAVKGVDLSKFEFDLLVIGGGTSGITAALEAAKFGKKVALCDSVQPTQHGTTWSLGGSPGGSGSVSKDLFYRASLLPHDLVEGDFFGWDVKNPEKFGWEKLAKSLEEHLKAVSWVHRKTLREAGVQYMNGWARFKDNHTVVLTDTENHEKELSARTIIIATGSKHRPMGVKGEEQNTLSVDDLLSLQRMEGNRALVIGSDKDGLEIAGILAGLRMETSVMVMRKILPRADECARDSIKKHLEALGVRFIENVNVISFEKVGESVRVEGKRSPAVAQPSSRALDFSQRKLSELGSRKSPPPMDIEADPQKMDPNAQPAAGPKDDSKTKTTGKDDSKTKSPTDKEPAKPDNTAEAQSPKAAVSPKEGAGAGNPQEQPKDEGKKEEKRPSKEASKNQSKEPSKKEVEGKGDGDKGEGKSTGIDKEGSKTKPMDELPQGEDFLEEFSVVIVAAGRRPNVADMGLQNLDVKLDSRTCKIKVNDFDQTSVDNIYAIGWVSTAVNTDVKGVAKKSAQLLARRLFDMSLTKMDYRKVPILVMTPLEYAYIGNSEESAKRLHGKIEVYHDIVGLPRRSLSNRFDSRSLIKLICAPKIPNVGTLVVGIHIVAPNAGEILQGFVPSFGTLTKECLDESAGIYPTMAANFVELNTAKSSGKEIGLNVI